MKMPKNLEELSSYGQASLLLDTEFSELERLGGQIERISLDSENDLDKARQLLVRFSESGQRISEHLPTMAKALDEARARAEAAAKAVGSRIAEIQNRQKEADELMARFQSLGEKIHAVTQASAKLPKPSIRLSHEEKGVLLLNLPTINSQLDLLSDEAARLKDDARSKKLRTLERNADSLSQRLKSVRNQLGKLAEQGESARV